MVGSAQAILRTIVRVVVSLLPWALTLYLHYWLEHGSVWEVDMPFRSALSVLLLATGMGLSFVLHAVLVRRGL